MEEWMRDRADDSNRLRLGLFKDIDDYTPAVDRDEIERLATQFNVSADTVLAGLRRMWWDRVQDELNAFDTEIHKLRYDPDAATGFAQRFL